MPLGVGSLVWEKWRRDWYMGQVVEEATDDQDDTSETVRRVKIHTHGEPETRDKWYDLPSANVVELLQVPAKETAIGMFPQAGKTVELLVVDAPLAKALHLDELTITFPLLTGTVLRVYPARDVSMVEVDYPSEYTLVHEGRRFVSAETMGWEWHNLGVKRHGARETEQQHGRVTLSSIFSAPLPLWLTMAWKGLVDSPHDQSETIQRLHEIESVLYVCRDGGDWEIALRADHDAILRELWELLLDVVCSPLWLRIRAAELLNVCFTLRSENLQIDRARASWLRSIVSSSCQILDELDPRAAPQATELFHWMAFLEHLLCATRDSQVFRHAVFRHATYASLLAKMVRLLGKCSTQLFAATTICLAAFHRHEMLAQESTVDRPTGQHHASVLLDVVLKDEAGREGIEHLGGALLHVINSCGYPCPEHRRSPLCDSIQLLLDILLHDQVSHVVYANDFKVLLDILLRECTDLPLEDPLRGEYLKLLDVALASPLFLDVHLYRKRELLKMLHELYEAGSAEDSTMPPDMAALVGRILLARIDRLD